MGRLFLLLLVTLGLAPGTWVRSSHPAAIDERPLLSLDRIEVPQGALGGAIEVAGAWHLRSSNFHFSGYSALLALGDGTLLAASDHRRELRFSPPGAARRPVRYAFFAPEEILQTRIDLEALTRDPVSGRIWAAYERTNHIERYEADFPIRLAWPRAMRGWPNNGGPEAMARLADGRFVVLSEGSPHWFAADLPGLVYADDPVGGAEPRAFRFRPPEDFVPVDMTQLPDGRVLILLRALRWGLPPTFESKLVVAGSGCDPARRAMGLARDRASRRAAADGQLRRACGRAASGRQAGAVADLGRQPLDVPAHAAAQAAVAAGGQRKGARVAPRAFVIRRSEELRRLLRRPSSARA